MNLQQIGINTYPDGVIAAFVCIAGMYLLCIAGGINEIYVADILELMCAVAFTIHMFTVDKYDKADGVKLSCIQFLTSGILSGILMLIFDKADINSIMKAIIPILYAGVMSSGIAYTFQIIGQKYAKPSVTAIVLSLESVFAALAGWILLGEHLSTRELTGCILESGKSSFKSTGGNILLSESPYKLYGSRRHGNGTVFTAVIVHRYHNLLITLTIVNNRS